MTLQLFHLQHTKSRNKNNLVQPLKNILSEGRVINQWNLRKPLWFALLAVRNTDA